MYQVQARVIYPGKNHGWSAPTRDMPTILIDCALSWGAAAKTVQLLDPFPDSGITVNMSVERIVSLYGTDIRAEFQRAEKPLDEERTEVEYYQQKKGAMALLKSAADFIEKVKK